MVVNANATQIGGLGSWEMSEAGWTAGFLRTGFLEGKTIASGVGIHIVVFVVVPYSASLVGYFKKMEPYEQSP
jgi:hypothetical protein